MAFLKRLVRAHVTGPLPSAVEMTLWPSTESFMVASVSSPRRRALGDDPERLQLEERPVLPGGPPYR